MFTEYTFIGVDSEDNYCEIMIDISETGKVIDIYTYRSDIPVLYNEETEKFYKVDYSEGKNSLFVHLKRKTYITKLLCNRFGFFYSRDDEETTDETLNNFYVTNNIH